MHNVNTTAPGSSRALQAALAYCTSQRLHEKALEYCRTRGSYLQQVPSTLET